MLHELHIENVAVIEKADIEFSSGLNVLTGETGAGKSIVIDAIGSVLGERVSRDLVRRGADRAQVTAVFDSDAAASWLKENDIDSDEELIITRRISEDGKSGCRVCGVPVTAAQLRELGGFLVDIHGQNDGRQLMDERLHGRYLDRFGRLEEELAAYQREYGAYSGLCREIDALGMDEIEKARLSENLKYQIAELERASLKAGEKEGLVARRDLLRNSEKLTEALELAFSALYAADENAVSLCQNAEHALSRVTSFAPELETALGTVRDASFALSDAAEQLRDFKDSLDFSPEEYDQLESRIALLSRLERKYGRDEAELPVYLEDCRNKLNAIEYADERREKLEKELSAQKKRCLTCAGRLSRLRHDAAVKLQERIETELRQLSMPSVRFTVSFEPLSGEPGFDSFGCETIRFLMSANAGEEPGRISRIASGGELSRIMLAMKNVFAENDPVPTLIFDEIDTGVSGIAAQRVGEKLYSVSVGKQVLCVTHLPQIASMADRHYRISKEVRDGRTFTKVEALDRSGQRTELARLHGGENITELTLASAEEQLVSAENYKARKPQ